MSFILISAGQTGADYGALLAAQECNTTIKGWANKGWQTENGPNYELKKLGLVENDNSSYASTDRRNVDISNGLIAFRYSIPNTGRGTECTVNYALTKKYKHVPLEEPGINSIDIEYQVYEGRKPVIVFWNLNEDNLEYFSKVLHSFLSKYNINNIMVSGPCESTVKCEQLIKQLLIKVLNNNLI